MKPPSRSARRPLGGNAARSPAYLELVSGGWGGEKGAVSWKQPACLAYFQRDNPDQCEMVAGGVVMSQQIEILGSF